MVLPYSTHDGSVWLRKHWSLSPFVWGGPTMAIGGITTPNNGLALDTQMTPEGGVERGGATLTEPGLVTAEIIMKRTQLDSVKVALSRNMWDIDMRVHCGGFDLDNQNKWVEITRLFKTRFSTHLLSGTSYDTDSEEQLIQLRAEAYERVDIKRVYGQELDVPGNELVTAACIAKKESGRTLCDPTEACIVYAVTEDAGAGSNLLVNESGGDHDGWAAPVPLSWAAANDANGIVGFGNFFIAVSNADNAIIYSDDQGVNQVRVVVTAPNCITAVDEFFILIGCDSGLIQVSYDNARTWSVLHNAVATSNDIIDMQFSSDDFQVIYALTASELIKTTNGGESWFQVAAVGASGDLTSMHVINCKQVLVGTDAGELYQTNDGADTWFEQEDIPFDGSGIKSNVEITVITGCGGGVVWLAYHDDAIGTNKTDIMRNVNAGAHGHWFVPEGQGQITNTNVIEDMVCCGVNRVLAVGGVAGVTDSLVLLK